MGDWRTAYQNRAPVQEQWYVGQQQQQQQQYGQYGAQYGQQHYPRQHQQYASQQQQYQYGGGSHVQQQYNYNQQQQYNYHQQQQYYGNYQQQQHYQPEQQSNWISARNRKTKVVKKKNEPPPLSAKELAEKKERERRAKVAADTKASIDNVLEMVARFRQKNFTITKASKERDAAIVAAKNASTEAAVVAKTAAENCESFVEEAKDNAQFFAAAARILGDDQNEGGIDESGNADDDDPPALRRRSRPRSRRIIDLIRSRPPSKRGKSKHNDEEADIVRQARRLAGVSDPQKRRYHPIKALLISEYGEDLFRKEKRKIVKALQEENVRVIVTVAKGKKSKEMKNSSKKKVVSSMARPPHIPAYKRFGFFGRSKLERLRKESEKKKKEEYEKNLLANAMKAQQDRMEKVRIYGESAVAIAESGGGPLLPVPLSHDKRYRARTRSGTKTLIAASGPARSPNKGRNDVPSWLPELQMEEQKLQEARRLLCPRWVRDIRRGETDEIDLTLAPVGSDGATLLAETMRSHIGSADELKRISMTHSRIGPDGAVALALAMRTHPKCTALIIPGGAIGSKGAQHMAAMLKVNSILKELDLTYNRIEADGAVYLSRAMQINTTLVKLHLRGCVVGEHYRDKASSALADMIRQNRSLTFLDLTNNSLRCVGAQAISGSLRVNDTLQDLRLGSNGIRDVGATAIAKAIDQKDGGKLSLQRLELDYNSIGAEGGMELALAIGRSPQLTYINLNNNALGADAARVIAMALEKTDVQLKTILFAQNFIGDDGAKCFATALRQNNSLIECDLSKNGIRDSGGKEMAQTMGLGFDFGLKPPGTPPPIEWKTGMKCQAKYAGKEQHIWFDAVITKVRDRGPYKGTVGVLYADGSRAIRLERHDVRLPVDKLDKSTKQSRFNRNLTTARTVNKSIKRLYLQGNLFNSDVKIELKKAEEENPFVERIEV
eukprot:g3551.t1